MRCGVRQKSATPRLPCSRSTATDCSTLREPSSTPGRRCECRSIMRERLPRAGSGVANSCRRAGSVSACASRASVISASAASRSSAARPARRAAAPRHRGRHWRQPRAPPPPACRRALRRRRSGAPAPRSAGGRLPCAGRATATTRSVGPLQPRRHDAGCRLARRRKPRHIARTGGGEVGPAAALATAQRRQPVDEVARLPTRLHQVVRHAPRESRPCPPCRTAPAPRSRARPGMCRRPPRSRPRSSAAVSATVTETPSMSTDVPCDRRAPPALEQLRHPRRQLVPFLEQLFELALQVLRLGLHACAPPAPAAPAATRSGHTPRAR